METAILLTRIEAYCLAKNVSASTFGRRAVNDGKLVGRLRAGKTITLQTFSRVNDFLSAEDDGAKAASRPVPNTASAAHGGAA